MTLPKNLQEKRDEMARDFENQAGRAAPYTDVTIDSSFRDGFDSACQLLLPEIEKLEDALGCISCDCYQTKSDFIPCKRCEALQSLREFLGSEAENE